MTVFFADDDGEEEGAFAAASLYCPSSCDTDVDDRPACGTDGISYANACMLQVLIGIVLLLYCVLRVGGQVQTSRRRGTGSLGSVQAGRRG